MKISEIIKGGTLNRHGGAIDDVLDTLQNNRNKIHRLSNIDGFELGLYKSNMETVLCLYNNEEIAGFISLYNNSYKGGLEIGLTFVEPKYRNKGLATKLYYYLLDVLKFPIYSGWTQSPAARTIWKKLLKDTNKYNIYLIKRMGGMVAGDPILINDKIHKLNPWSSANRNNSILIVPK